MARLHSDDHVALWRLGEKILKTSGNEVDAC
jgi:hypothetical protein